MEIDDIVKRVIAELSKSGMDVGKDDSIPAGVSNRHIHLSKMDLTALFGQGAKLTRIKDLSQPGQFACQECVIIAGPKGCIEKVRVLGPVRENTQVEILASDCYKLGINAPVRESGHIDNTPGIVVLGPAGSLLLKQGVIIAQRHIHMTQKDAERFNCSNGEKVSVEFSGIRGGRMDNVIVRVSDKYALDFHIDIDEANCFGIKDRDHVRILK